MSGNTFMESAGVFYILAARGCPNESAKLLDFIPWNEVIPCLHKEKIISLLENCDKHISSGSEKSRTLKKIFLQLVEMTRHKSVHFV